MTTIRLVAIVASITFGFPGIAPVHADDDTAADRADDSVVRDHLNQGMLVLEAAERLAPLASAPSLADAMIPALPEPATTMLDGPALYRQVEAATVMLHTASKCGKCENWHGGVATGFVIHPDGWVVTAAHVVNDLEADEVCAAMMFDEAVHPVLGIYAVDTRRDLAIIKIDAKNLPTVPLAIALPEPGEAVSVMSHPQGRYYLLTRGVVSRVVPDAHAKHRIQITAGFAKGSSGAPVVDDSGNVVAVALSTHTIYASPEEKKDPQLVIRNCASGADVRALIEETQGEDI